MKGRACRAAFEGVRGALGSEETGRCNGQESMFVWVLESLHSVCKEERKHWPGGLAICGY